jgi:hypothetical protein
MALLAGAAQCAETFQIPWDKLKDTSQRYLNACVETKTAAKMAKKFKERVEQKIQDSGWDEDTCMRTIMLDWAAGSRGDLQKKEPKTVAQACFYFVVFMDKGYFIPGQIRDSLTQDAVKEILEHLEQEIKAGQKRL